MAEAGRGGRGDGGCWCARAVDDDANDADDAADFFVLSAEKKIGE